MTYWVDPYAPAPYFWGAPVSSYSWGAPVAYGPAQQSPASAPGGASIGASGAGDGPLALGPQYLSDVPVAGDASTTGGWSVGDALTYSSGSFLYDALAGAGVAWLVAPEKQRVLFAAVGALAAGGLGAFGLLVILGAALIARR